MGSLAAHHLDSDSDWDPTVLDSKISNKTDWHLATQLPPSTVRLPFDRTGFTDRPTWTHLCLSIP
jgi:hypothetical protein